MALLIVASALIVTDGLVCERAATTARLFKYGKLLLEACLVILWAVANSLPAPVNVGDQAQGYLSALITEHS